MHYMKRMESKENMIHNQYDIILNKVSFSYGNENILDGVDFGGMQWSVDDNSSGRVREIAGYVKQKATGTWNSTAAPSIISFGVRQSSTVFNDDVVVINQLGAVGIGTSTPAASALLDLTSTTGALLLPRMTETQRDALTAVNGMIIYNSTDDELNFYAAGAWEIVAKV